MDRSYLNLKRIIHGVYLYIYNIFIKRPGSGEFNGLRVFNEFPMSGSQVDGETIGQPT